MKEHCVNQDKLVYLIRIRMVEITDFDPTLRVLLKTCVKFFNKKLSPKVCDSMGLKRFNDCDRSSIKTSVLVKKYIGTFNFGRIPKPP